MLGNMLLQEGKVALGTTMLTAAYEKAQKRDRNLIAPLQEHAFALCNEVERRMENFLVPDIIKK